jgi:hypothetical protein
MSRGLQGSRGALFKGPGAAEDEVMGLMSQLRLMSTKNPTSICSYAGAPPGMHLKKQVLWKQK